MREFERVMAPTKLPKDALLPAYGMAEATLAIAFKPLGQSWKTVLADTAAFQGDGEVVAAIEGEAALELVSCGPAFKSFDLRIRSESGEWLADGKEGEICIKGPSVTPGYYQNPEATSASFVDGFLRTGDLGVLLDGHVYVTGRLKDLIILNGRNLHPQSVEWVVATVDGVRKGNAVAFSRPGAHSEELVVAVEAKAPDLDKVAADVRHAVQRELGITVADVVCLAPGTLPKTSSGKLQRRKTRQHYLEGALGHGGTRTVGANADRVTLARHVAKSMWSRAKATVLFR